MAAKKILVAYDFTKNEIQNSLLHVLASAPGSPAEGQHYYDSTTKRWNFRTDTAWIDPTARANHSGTQLWSTITSTPTTLSGYGISDGQPLDADLTALAALAATAGMLSRTGANTFAVRTLTSGTTALTIADPTGAAANPTFSIADVVAAGASGLMTGADKTKLNGIATGATANSSDATLLARANHTGTQLASTISDFNTAVRTNRLDQMAAPTATVSMNSQILSNVLNPVNDQDAATKKYVDDTVAGLSWKDEVRVATTANGTLASAFANGSTVDGVVLATNDRILLKDQTTQTENGIYIVQASGAPVRALDANTGAEVNGSAVFVTNGTANNGTRWVCNTNAPITLGSTNLTFVQFGAGSVYTAGNGLTLSANDFNVGAGTGITVNANDVAVDIAVVPRKYTQLIGNGSATSIAVTHSLSNQWVHAQVVEVATLKQVECDIEWTNSSTATFIFTVAPAASALRVIIFG